MTAAKKGKHPVCKGGFLFPKKPTPKRRAWRPSPESVDVALRAFYGVHGPDWIYSRKFVPMMRRALIAAAKVDGIIQADKPKRVHLWK